MHNFLRFCCVNRASNLYFIMNIYILLGCLSVISLFLKCFDLDIISVNLSKMLMSIIQSLFIRYTVLHCT